MEHRVRKQSRRNINYRYFIYAIIAIALLQFVTLKYFYREKISKIPDNLFVSKINFPISELVLDISHGETQPISSEDSDSTSMAEDTDTETETDETTELTTETANNTLSDIQKDIALKALEFLEEDIEYSYQVFSDGYPDNNVWVSTDLISITLHDCGYDLMELMYKDMIEHKEDYPLDDKGRKTPIKNIDFRDVIFQEKFFSRNALTTLPHEYDPDDENTNFLWQAGDIVYFRFDEDNPDKDRGGFISPHSSENGIPLVIMIYPETNKLEEVDVLQEYEIIGHYRYPQPEV
jgi:uncharacterized protein